MPEPAVPRLLANPVLGEQPHHPHSPSSHWGELLHRQWSWLPVAERQVKPRSRCHRAEPHRHQPLPSPKPPAQGEPAHACLGEKGPLGWPGPHLCCRQLGSCPCPPRGPGGSSSLQPLPPALPPPAKPLARAAPSLPLSMLPERGPRQCHARGPQPSPPQHVAVPRGSGGPGGTVPLCPGGLGAARQGGSPHCQLSPAPSHPLPPGLW